MKNKIIEEQNIRLKIHATDWEEAMRLSGQLLVNSGYITEEYIGLTIKSVKEHGPYIVLAPGLALAHYRPVPWVIKPGISLITLDSPVCFHCENDPVSVVFTLAARDSDSHLFLLQAIAELFSREDTMELLLQMDDASAAAALLNRCGAAAAETESR